MKQFFEFIAARHLDLHIAWERGWFSAEILRGNQDVTFIDPKTGARDIKRGKGKTADAAIYNLVRGITERPTEIRYPRHATPQLHDYLTDAVPCFRLKAA